MRKTTTQLYSEDRRPVRPKGQTPNLSMAQPVVFESRLQAANACWDTCARRHFSGIVDFLRSRDSSRDEYPVRRH